MPAVKIAGTPMPRVGARNGSMEIMTVRELASRLSGLDPELEVIVHASSNQGGGAFVIEDIEAAGFELVRDETGRPGIRFSMADRTNRYALLTVTDED